MKATLQALEDAPRIFNRDVKSWEVYGPEGSLRGYLGRSEEGWSAHALPKWGNFTVGYSSRKKALAAFGFEGVAAPKKASSQEQWHTIEQEALGNEAVGVTGSEVGKLIGVSTRKANTIMRDMARAGRLVESKWVRKMGEWTERSKMRSVPGGSIVWYHPSYRGESFFPSSSIVEQHKRGGNPKVRSTFVLDGITFRLLRVTGRGREGGTVKGWNVYSPDGALLVDWAPTADAAKSSVRQNIQHFGKAWAHKRGDNPKTSDDWGIGRLIEAKEALPPATPGVVGTVKRKLGERRVKKAGRDVQRSLVEDKLYWSNRVLYGPSAGGRHEAAATFDARREARALGISDRSIDRIEAKAKRDGLADLEEKHKRGGNPKTKLAAPEAAELPIGSIVRSAGDDYLVIVPGGALPITVLPERAASVLPTGEPVEQWGDGFTLVHGGRGRVPTHSTAQRHAIAWAHKRGDNPRTKGSDIVPEMTEAQSKARVKKLRAQGYTVRKVEVPGVGTVVMKSKKKRGKKKAASKRRKSTLRKSDSTSDAKLKARMKALIGR